MPTTLHATFRDLDTWPCELSQPLGRGPGVPALGGVRIGFLIEYRRHCVTLLCVEHIAPFVQKYPNLSLPLSLSVYTFLKKAE